MKKVYLLLRNNSQTGPYTIDELLQQHLKPTDLIWKEGATAWQHPFEMDEFSITIAKNEQALLQDEGKNLHFQRKPKVKTAPREKSLPPVAPVDPIEQRAEEIRRRALQYKPSTEQKLPQLQEELEYSYPVQGALEDVRVVYHREKKRSVDLTQPITFALIVIWLGAVWFKGNIPWLTRKAEPVNGIATQMMTQDMHAAAGSAIHPSGNPAATMLSGDSVQRRDSIHTVVHTPKHKIAAPNLTTPSAPESTEVRNDVVAGTPSDAKPDEKKQASDITKSIVPNTDAPVKVDKEPVKEPKEVGTTNETREPAVQPQAKEEHKGGFLKNLFRKKKKEEEEK